MSSAQEEAVMVDYTSAESASLPQAPTQSIEAGDAGIGCAHDQEAYRPTNEEAHQSTDEELYQPTDEEHLEVDEADGAESAFSDDDVNAGDWYNCESCEGSQEMYRAYCQNCDRPDNNPAMICFHCDGERGRVPCDDCQGFTYYDRAKIDLSAAVVSYNPRHSGRYLRRDDLFSTRIGSGNTLESVIRLVVDEDARAATSGPMFDDRSPLVLSVDEYHLFPGRTYGEGSWTITIGKDRASPGGVLQNIRRSIVDELSDLQYLLVTRPKQLVWKACQSIKEKVRSIQLRVQKKTKVVKGHYEYMREPIVETTHINVKDAESLKIMLNNLEPVFTADEEPMIGLDLEGVDLGRHGEACVMQIADYLTGHNYLVDLQYLSQKAFTTQSDGNDLTLQNVKYFVKQKVFHCHPEDKDESISSQQIVEWLSDMTTSIFRTNPDEHKITLKDILESPRIKKLLWDVRMDSDALYAHFGIKLAGVWDLQLMRVYLNNFSRRPRLAVSVRAEGVLQGEELTGWERSKAYHFPRGYEEWRERPVSSILKAYAIGDVTPMEKMLQKLRPQLGVEGMLEVERMTDLLIEETWQRVYVSTRAMSPWVEAPVSRDGYVDGNGKWVSWD